MVHDSIWGEAGMTDGVLCVGCIERRLGRMLVPVDFADAPINEPDSWDTPRLASRKVGDGLQAKCATDRASAMTGDAEHWRQVLEDWTHAEEPGRDFDAWRARLTDPRPGREHMMEPDERELLANAPDRLRIFRGAVRGVNERGLAWTMRRDDALGWAHRNIALHDGGEAVLVTASVAREDVIAITMRRLEAEVIAAPEDVLVIRVEDAGTANCAAAGERRPTDGT